MIAAAGESPFARQPIAAFDRNDLAGGRVGAAQEGIRIGGPHIVLRGEVEQRQQPVMPDGDQRAPGRRRAGGRQRQSEVEQKFAAIFEPAGTGGLADAQKLGLFQFGDHGGRDPALLFGFARMGGDIWSQRRGAREQFGGRCPADPVGLIEHGPAPLDPVARHRRCPPWPGQAQRWLVREYPLGRALDDLALDPVEAVIGKGLAWIALGLPTREGYEFLFAGRDEPVQ